jgi:hypothetical protein
VVAHRILEATARKRKAELKSEDARFEMSKWEYCVVQPAIGTRKSTDLISEDVPAAVEG